MSQNKLQYTGINEVGLEFAGAGTSCTPKLNSIEQFASLGHNLFRIPFGWEGLQPKLHGELNPSYLQALDGVVQNVINQGAVALIDCHNYFRYNGNLLDKSDLDAFGDLWNRLSKHYAHHNPNQLWFGLMNEPHNMSTETVFALHQHAITAIRSNGNQNKIIVSGNGWDNLAHWADWFPYYGSANTNLNKLKDPQNNYCYEMHIYFDVDGSGTHGECTQIDWNGIKRTTSWLRAKHKQCLITEFGLGKDDNSVYNYGEPFLKYLQDNSDVFLGYTYWAAGTGWPNDYIFTLDPNNGIPISDKRIQLLSKYSAAANNPAAKPSSEVESSSAQP